MINFKKINLLVIFVLFLASPEIVFGMVKCDGEKSKELSKEDEIKAKKLYELIKDGKTDTNIALGMIKTEEEVADNKHFGESLYKLAYRKVPDPKKVLFKKFFRAATWDFSIDCLKKFDKFIDEKKIDVNATYKFGRTALEEICYNFGECSPFTENDLEKVKYLVSKGANIIKTGFRIIYNNNNERFFSKLEEVLAPLREENKRLFDEFCEALQNGTFDDVKKFEKPIQEKKININAGFEFGRTVLDFLCCDRGDEHQEKDCEKIEFLIKNGAFVKEKDIKFYFGPESKREKILKLLQETYNNKIIEENIKRIEEKKKEARKEAKKKLLNEFDRAVDLDSVEELKKFVEKNKVDVNDVYTFGFSLLRYLCFISYKDSNYELIEYLVKNCAADVNITFRKSGSSSRYSALYWACTGKNEKTTKLLLKKDALFLKTDFQVEGIEEEIAFRDKILEELKMGSVKKEDGQTSNLDVLFN